MSKNYVLKTGKFGQYIHETERDWDVPLDEVIKLLNNPPSKTEYNLGKVVSEIRLDMMWAAQIFEKEFISKKSSNKCEENSNDEFVIRAREILNKYGFAAR